MSDVEQAIRVPAKVTLTTRSGVHHEMATDHLMFFAVNNTFQSISDHGWVPVSESTWVRGREIETVSIEY